VLTSTNGDHRCIQPLSSREPAKYKMRTIFTLLTFVALSMLAADKPNVVLIFIDDMGYGDIGPFGNKVNKTPHLDRMAKEGLKLTQFYVSNTACTPSRSALMTGTYAHRIGMDGRVVFPGEKRGLTQRRSLSRNCSRNRATQPAALASGISVISRNSCRWPRALTNILESLTPMTCGRETRGAIH